MKSLWKKKQRESGAVKIKTKYSTAKKGVVTPVTTPKSSSGEYQKHVFFLLLFSYLNDRSMELELRTDGRGSIRQDLVQLFKKEQFRTVSTLKQYTMSSDFTLCASETIHGTLSLFAFAFQ